MRLNYYFLCYDCHKYDGVYLPYFSEDFWDIINKIEIIDNYDSDCEYDYDNGYEAVMERGYFEHNEKMYKYWLVKNIFVRNTLVKYMMGRIWRKRYAKCIEELKYHPGSVYLSEMVLSWSGE